MDGPAAKKIKIELNQLSEDAHRFTERRLPDDIILKFDEGKELFASRGLLMCASPIFEKNMKDPNTTVVDLSGNNYHNFGELLRCLHPGINKRVTNDNVFYLVELAQKYRLKQVLDKCRDAFKIMMRHENLVEGKDFPDSIPEINVAHNRLKVSNLGRQTDRDHRHNIRSTNRILEVLSFAFKSQNEYFDLIDEAVGLLSYIKTVYYLDFAGKVISSGLSKEDLELLDQNRDWFKQIPIVEREKIYKSRLSLIDTKDM